MSGYRRKARRRRNSQAGALRAEPPEVRALFEKARRNDGSSTPRKHHLVPASYLNRWSEGGQVRVTEVNERRTYTTSPEKAARETDYYRLESADVDPSLVPPLLFETVLGEVEGWGKQAIDALLCGQPWEVDPELVVWLATYLAFQHTRGHLFRQQYRHSANEFFKLSYSEITDEGIHNLLERSGGSVTEEDVQDARRMLDDLQSGELYVQPQDVEVIGQAGKLAEAACQALLAREWVVYKTPPVLITCDEPVIAIGGPGFPRGERAGLVTAGVVAFPLAPNAVLVTFRRGLDRLSIPNELDYIELAELNYEILASAARWAFERPQRKISTRLEVPPSPEPTAREMFSVVGDDNRQVMRSYRPNRWSNAQYVPDWPVAKWWR